MNGTIKVNMDGTINVILDNGAFGTGLTPLRLMEFMQDEVQWYLSEINEEAMA